METAHTGLELAQLLKKAGDMAMDDFGLILQKLALDAFRSLVRRSATDTGFLRSNWSVVVDKKPPEQVKKNPGTKMGYDTTVVKIKPNAGSIVVLYNNTEYAIYLEYGIDMEAQPMIAPTIVELTIVAKKLVGALSRRKYNV